MLESFLFIIADRVLGKLSSLVYNEIYLACSVKTELKKITGTLSTIQAVLLDAEEKQQKNNQLRLWLRNLKEVLYDADDMLDEVEYEALRQQVVNRGSLVVKVRRFFSSSNPLALNFILGHKIKKIRERLYQISNDRTRFNLETREMETRDVGQRRETYPFLDSSVIIGREEEKKIIVDHLMQPDEHGSVSVIAIVGIGGQGKTALAKMVYNDPVIDEKFQLKIWVCVSEDFNVEMVIARIVRFVTQKKCDDLNINELQNCLGKEMNGKRYLLILDDVWNEDRAKWVELKGFLKGGAPGSKILVTTRSELVASTMSAHNKYKLEGLSFDDCLSLFMRWAFEEGKHQHYPNLIEVGKNIVKKCKGVPLAAKTLGGLLYGKFDESYWKSVRDNEICRLEQKEDDILPALKLSYDHLPSHLKQCFAYCSIFAKDYEIGNIELICHWIAQGLIRSSDKMLELDKIGEEYIRDLLSRSFFQDISGENYFYTFKMHDLMHDLAMSAAQPEHITTSFHGNVQNNSKGIRHVSFCDKNSSLVEVPNYLLEDGKKKVRSIYLQFDEAEPTSSFVKTCFLRFKCLRMLKLTNSSFELLPSSISGLIYLRYLDLSYNKRIRMLPNSFCKLHCLHTLLLVGCSEFGKLPRDFGNLISLRNLCITTKERFLPGKAFRSLTSLRCMGISQSDNLQCLFDDDDDVIWMQQLHALRRLVIFGCDSLLSLPRGLRRLNTLENLTISCCDKLDLKIDDGINHDGGLCSLQNLHLYRLPELMALPQWLFLQSHSTLNANLKNIEIAYCPNLSSFPKCLENLKSHQKLSIIECPKLTYVPEPINQEIASKCRL